jgi:hypothetical protein
MEEANGVGTFYENNPDLRDYFESLPIDVKNRILESGVEISTLGELMKVAEHFGAAM